MHPIKAGIGTALAILVACDPVDGTGSDAGTTADGGTAATSGLVALNADGLCNRLINECGYQTQQVDCINTFHPLLVTAGCNSGIPGASCADLLSNTSAIATLCFPKCTTGTAPVCNGNGTLTSCTSTGNTHVNSCDVSCTADGYTAWTGSCGTSYAGETAPQAQCWCR